MIAAADYLAKQDYIDPDRIYLGGHSTGGTLVLLCAAASDQFRAVFAFGPVDEVIRYGDAALPFNVKDPKELELRNPVNWLNSIKSPTFAIEGENGNAYSLQMMQIANTNPLVKCYVVEQTDHFRILGPINELLAKKVYEDTEEHCNITITPKELREAMSTQ